MAAVVNFSNCKNYHMSSIDELVELVFRQCAMRLLRTFMWKRASKQELWFSDLLKFGFIEIISPSLVDQGRLSCKILQDSCKRELSCKILQYGGNLGRGRLSCKNLARILRVNHLKISVKKHKKITETRCKIKKLILERESKKFSSWSEKNLVFFSKLTVWIVKTCAESAPDESYGFYFALI